METCSECDADVPVLDDAMAGEIVTCPECGAGFELVGEPNAFELRPAQTVGEDWGQ